MDEVVLVSNGPGELYTWVQPVLAELKRQRPDLRVVISLIPCQFASGQETKIAATFGADGVTAPPEFVRFMAAGKRPAAYAGRRGLLISLGGNTAFAVQLAERLGYLGYRYGFTPNWHRKLRKLFVDSERTLRQARRLGAPAERVERVGNLVADAVRESKPAPRRGDPQILLMPGSRELFAVHLIPFMIGLADALAARYPNAGFVWPVSRLLSADTIEAGIAGRERATLGGAAGRREGNTVITPGGAAIVMVAEDERYAEMRSADLAITIPGTNTLELGIAGVPAVVMLPLNRPELIPLEGFGHWLGLIPLVGTALKRHAVRLFVEGLSQPVSLPNRLSGENLMREVTGKVSVERITRAAAELLDDPAALAAVRARLAATMPAPGAAAKLVRSALLDSGLADDRQGSAA